MQLLAGGMEPLIQAKGGIAGITLGLLECSYYLLVGSWFLGGSGETSDSMFGIFL